MTFSLPTKRILQWWTPLVMANQFLFFMGINTRMLFGFLILGVLLGCAAWKGNAGNPFSKVVLGFIIYSLLSGILFLFHEVPFLSYIIEVDKYLCAMAFFFIGCDRNNTGDDYEKWFLMACMVCFLVGFYLYFFPPSWYSRQLVAMRALHWYKSAASEATIVDYSRFSSFWANSYPISFFGVAALGCSFLQMAIGTTRLDRFCGWIGIFVCWLACILSQERIAMACSTLTVGMHLLYSGIVERKKYALWLAGGVGLAVLLAVTVDFDTFGQRFSVVSGQLQQRTNDMSFDTAMATRTHQYQTALENWESVWFGYGIGSASGYARSQNFIGVNDGNYIKILYEQGTVGLTWFALILLGSLVRGVRHFPYYRFETGILVFFILAAIGANAFCINGLFVMPFWYAVGRIWNPVELERRKALVQRQGRPLSPFPSIHSGTGVPP